LSHGQLFVAIVTNNCRLVERIASGFDSGKSCAASGNPGSNDTYDVIIVTFNCPEQEGRLVFWVGVCIIGHSGIASFRRVGDSAPCLKPVLSRTVSLSSSKMPICVGCGGRVSSALCSFM
jgi:hypothetical protein